MSDIVQKLWGFCHTLRHDGVDYGDYIEQLTYLLFLKMAEERGAVVPKNHDWASLKAESGTALTDHYADILRKLREQPGILGDIFAQSDLAAQVLKDPYIFDFLTLAEPFHERELELALLAQVQ